MVSPADHRPAPVLEGRGGRTEGPLSGRLDAVIGALTEASVGVDLVLRRALVVAAPEVTLRQFEALSILAATPMSAGALAAALRVGPSTVTRFCDRLVEHRLVLRSSGADRRGVTIELTGSGRRVVDRVRLQVRRDVTHLEGFSEGDAEVLVELLEAFTAALLGPLDGLARAASVDLARRFG